MRSASIDNRIQQLAFILLLLTIFAHIWFASTPLPFGGPNVIIASLAILTAAVYGVRALMQRRLVFTRNLVSLVVVSLLLFIWVGIVYIRQEDMLIKGPTHRRMIQIALGICSMIAVYLSIDNIHRVRLMLGAVVIAVCVSSLFGLATAFIGDPFWDIWTTIASVTEKTLSIAKTGRITGLAVTPITFSYQLAAAIPSIFAMFLYDSFRGKTYSPVLGAILLILTITMMINATRSMVLGVMIAVGIIAVASLKWLPRRRPLVLAILLVIFGQLISVGLHLGGVASQVGRLVKFSDMSAQGRLPLIYTAVEYSLENPLGTGKNYSPSIRHINPNSVLPKNTQHQERGNRLSIRHIIRHIDPKNSVLAPKMVKFVQRYTPHNQFLVILVYYGYPGLALLLLFYLFVIRSLHYSNRLARQRPSQNIAAFFLLLALVGGLTAYLINSLFHNAGPFVGDWYAFIFIGLVASIERILQNSAERTPAPSLMNPDPANNL